MNKSYHDTVACRPVARQRRRDKQLYNSRYSVMALQTTAFARQLLSNDHLETPTDTNATMVQQQRDGVLCRVRADVISRTSWCPRKLKGKKLRATYWKTSECLDTHGMQNVMKFFFTNISTPSKRIWGPLVISMGNAFNKKYLWRRSKTWASMLIRYCWALVWNVPEAKQMRKP
jgi:hypothetical protein